VTEKDYQLLVRVFRECLEISDEQAIARNEHEETILFVAATLAEALSHERAKFNKEKFMHMITRDREGV
jgi:hypothetical protein